ncbi:putative tail protein [Palleronia aestuarii]|uniref:Putative tail protein n=1 Tax=Palleronia aestuarii TaxID=568105 RepID=A0A2W7NM31_9RHOB|nr:glycoside hydrolase/phage tail family protein [Palleronia aestuarii]PZX17704.1 putative tail protein [Palleronia aestuarii]
MATLVLSAAGAAAGGALGSSVLGLSSAVIGKAVGATLGRVVDASVLGAGSEPVETGRVDRFRLTSAGEGTPVSRIFGRMRIGGQVIWSSNFVEDLNTTSAGGKGAPSSPEVSEYSYSVSLALALCEGRIARVGRIWADGQEIAGDAISMSVYHGGEDQLPDPLVEAIEGVGNVPAYRGLAYVVIENLALGPYGNRVPQLTFEVIRPEQERANGHLTDMSRQVRAVAMMPGTGEYALATTPVRLDHGPGVSHYSNVNTPSGATDFAASLDALVGELPRCGAASLIVSWFGDDLRCGHCTVEPKVEQNEIDGVEMSWRAGGIGRSAARTIPLRDGSVIYGGTPSDASVVEAIRALNAADQEVMFYPFILMEQLPGNSLPDPYGAEGSQPSLPWRGRITLDVAPGREGSADGTARADDDVAAFFGTAAPGDFSISGGEVRYSGPPEWRYRRFILHYAFLCRLAGGVESFCIGSEMRGLTQIRGTAGFPAVAELRRLAGELRAILGPDCKISYAADWSEYFGYHPQDGSGDVYFHLDPLWADENIDFIGIDNYMPISDWRDDEDHADAPYGSIYNLDYLKANILGGEGFNWYYPTPEVRKLQARHAITDGTHDEAWVYRYKDLPSWWSKRHHDRIGGVRSSAPSAWVPRMKPIRFTELGCAAIDKGTNQPNKFLDPKSSESAIPYFSNGRRDDFMQLQYLRAVHEFWAEAENNPASDVYGGRMLDMDKAYVWAWDARPYPYFPGNAELWSDAENYGRGHWITGRSASRALASVVREICAASGVTEIDVDALWGVVRGYGVAELGDARAALQPLMLAFGFDAVEREGTLLFRSRDGRVTRRLDQGGLVSTDPERGALQATRNPEAEQVGRIKLTFIGADADFETRSAEAIFPDERSIGVSQSELPILLTQAEGRAITERWLSETRVARDTARFALPLSQSALGAGDVVELKDGRYRLDHVEQSGYLQVEAVRIEPELYEPGEASDGIVRLGRYRAPSPVLPVFLDLPLLTGDEVPHAPYLAIAARPWPGPVSVLSSSEDAGYALQTRIARAATIGHTKTFLRRAEPGLYDRSAVLRVELVRGTLASVSEEALLSGANALAIGSGTNDIWEVLQFREATLVAPRTYDLRLLLRGQAGTDAVTPERWPAGSTVVLLNGAPRQLDMAVSQRGVARHYRIGPATRPVSDPSYVHAHRAFEGVGLRPYAPVHLTARRREGAIELDWIRRTRRDGDAWQGLDVPLAEERELYLVRILQGERVLREEVVTRSSWTCSLAELAAASAGGPLRAAVAQVSESYGPGPFRELDLG